MSTLTRNQKGTLRSAITRGRTVDDLCDEFASPWRVGRKQIMEYCEAYILRREEEPKPGKTFSYFMLCGFQV